MHVMRHGIAAEFASEHAVVDAIGRARAHGLTLLAAYGPYPSDAVDGALAISRSRMPLAAGLGGLAGAIAAYALQWYLVAYLYPIDLGGRPPHMPLAYLIITIEMGFLVGALTVFIALLVAARLMRLWDPIDEVPGIESATRDKFWLAIDGNDPALGELGNALDDALRVATFGGAP